MINSLKSALRHQLSAAVEMLNNAIEHCPDDIWNQNKGFADFWYISFHTIFWLDFYLTNNPDDYVPYENFGITEHDPEGILPEKVFSKEELGLYISHCKLKLKNVIENLDEENWNKEYKFHSLKMPFLEMMFYNMRHVQHHTAQLNLMLRQKIDSAPKWVRRVEDL